MSGGFLVFRNDRTLARPSNSGNRVFVRGTKEDRGDGGISSRHAAGFWLTCGGRSYSTESSIDSGEYKLHRGAPTDRSDPTDVVGRLDFAVFAEFGRAASDLASPDHGIAVDRELVREHIAEAVKEGVKRTCWLRGRN